MKENPCITVVAERNIGDDQNTRRLTMIASGTDSTRPDRNR
jgi:hypothetical protein